MPSFKTLLNSFLILFILFSIPVTVMIARRASTSTRAANAPFSVKVNPDNQTLMQGGSYPYSLEFTFSEIYKKNPVPVYLQFSGIPEGVILLPQPIGATPSNNYQSLHKFNLMTTPKVPVGTYTVEVTVSDLTRIEKTSFTFNLKTN